MTQKSRLIGYRLSLQKKKHAEIYELLKLYKSTFGNYCEFKLPLSYLEQNALSDLNFIIKNFGDLVFSLHLPKDLLCLDKYRLNKIGEVLLSLSVAYQNVYCITHFPHEALGLNYKQHAEMFCRILEYLPQNFKLLLENPKVNYSLNEYISFLGNMGKIATKSKHVDIKFCLDIGHILSSFENESISQYRIFKLLEEMPEYLNNVREIHIHDYVGNTDHICLGNGNIDIYNFTAFVRKNELSCNIVIETNVNNPLIDGLEQFMKLNNL